MGERDASDSRIPQRDTTDDNLRVEREKADAQAAASHKAMTAAADDVVQTARERADDVVRTARDRADDVLQAERAHEDTKHPQPSAADTARLARERTEADHRIQQERLQADARLAAEYAAADSLLTRERTAQTHCLNQLLAEERAATDASLISEREAADDAVLGRDRFLAIVCHDLRSVLNGLSMTADLLALQAPEGAGGDRQRSIAATNKRMVAQMNRLLNDLLDVASIEAGKLTIVAEPVAIRDLLHDTIEAFKPVAAAKGIALEAVAATAPGRARLDGGRIFQVLTNLVGNAIKFTQAGGRVTIRASTDGRQVQFAVSDTGIGIPAAELPVVFERYRQIRQDRRGLGLGLYISKSIVEAHGGRMWAESTEGAGSTFFLSLPVSGPR